ncbi:Asp23/Gls24 family envelope stress response protein [Antrihabitans sp. YC3-6]|uniref:Asp23/Gls24 family envelope stress response protein n=1 Tax=Antrihabitans stalagmiti TaxID=2799499 RepID=A0A934U2P0_9NOCA|nr:Asp23/Gls24 family envelope stress response protein [Antrihabitans stalagmiti]MBJ8338942.1 Asp23/Gls24 family envelope stress response protein [Antrihabitans stalagmiti]
MSVNSTPGRDEPELADTVAHAVLAVDGVAELHGGIFGEAATYLPGRRVSGIRLTDAGTEIHVSLALGTSIRTAADEIRTAVAALVPGPVHVIVEDVIRSAAR